MGRPDWMVGFERWTKQPCPEGEWLYRGQPARYASITPSLWRDGHHDFYLFRGLYQIDLDIAEQLFSSSPVFGEDKDAVFPRLIRDEAGREMERLAYAMGGPPAMHPDLSFTELVRALAQHYGFATFFVDVTPDPIVAAMFATHEMAGAGYVPGGAAATVFRWPATRISETRLQIPLSGQDDEDAINVIDLTDIHPMMRRPHVQRACLATPVSDPKPVYQPFSSPMEALDIIDMAGVHGCESFELPGGAGQALAEFNDVTMQALVPDRIDLGYSYLTVIGLLSMIVHNPSGDLGDKWHNVSEEAYRTGMSMGETLLGRECLRLDPGFTDTGTAYRYMLNEIEHYFDVRAQEARLAIGMMKSGATKAETERRLKERESEMRKEAEARFGIWVDAVRAAKGAEYADALRGQGPPAYTLRRADDYEWIEGELDRRLERLRSLLGAAERVPVYALLDPVRYSRHLDMFSRDPAYEREVVRLSESVTRWRPNS